MVEYGQPMPLWIIGAFVVFVILVVTGAACLVLEKAQTNQEARKTNSLFEKAAACAFGAAAIAMILLPILIGNWHR